MKLSPIGSAKTPTSKSRRRRRTCRWQFVRLSVPLSRCLSCCPCLCDVARRPVTAARRRRLLVSRSSSVLGIAVLLLQTFTRLAGELSSVSHPASPPSLHRRPPNYIIQSPTDVLACSLLETDICDFVSLRTRP